VKEQSHKAEMSAALRGDFQRLRARGVSAALVPQDDGDPDEEPLAAEERSAAPAETPPELPAETPAEAPAAAAPDTPEDEPPARRGWLSRFAGR
jgi:hypothetical protein